LFGNSARDLDPAHRRDGAGLAVLAAAIVTTGASWWGLGSAAGHGLTELIRGTFGVAAWTLPILLLLLAWRLLRHPDRNAHTGRMVIGWTAFLAGALAIVHIALGSPGPAAGVAAMHNSGGLIGFAISAPLQALLTTWAAIPLLGLLAAFGILVITGTPLHRVPERCAEIAFLIRRAVRGEEAEVAEEDLGAAAGELAAPRASRRRGSAAIEAGEHDKPYDSPLLGGLVPRSSGRGARGAGPAAAAAGAVAPAGAENAAQAGVPANRTSDDEVIAEALMFGTSTTSHGYGGRGTGGTVGPAGAPRKSGSPGSAPMTLRPSKPPPATPALVAARRRRPAGANS
jgi:S-DNA-T family DNA segregation ATPase FtsK/SpoIIIE